MECSVCLMELIGNGRATLNCGHSFHLSCIVKWLKAKGSESCPMCREPVTEQESLRDDNPSTVRLVRGVTPIMFAITNNDVEEVKQYLRLGESVNAIDSDGDSPLVYSVSNRHESITEILLAAGADVKVLGRLVSAPQTPDGALAAAACFYSHSCLKKLLTMSVTLEGVKRACTMASLKNYMDIVHILLLKENALKSSWSCI